MMSQSTGTIASEIQRIGEPRPSLGGRDALRPIAVAYKSDPVRGAVWHEMFQSQLPEASFRIWPEIGIAEEVEYLVAWVPPPDLESALPNLKVLFSIGAGIDQLNLDAIPPHVKVVRMLDPDLTRGMVEYATLGVLALHRDLPHFVADQQAGRWSHRSLHRAVERRVGIMGLGILGHAVAEALQTFGFPLRGWSASPKTIDGMQTFAGLKELGAFLSGCDILICLLPLTDETRGILCRATFEQLPMGARLLNVGRGGHLIEDDLIAALASGRIDCAILDVLQDEPPAADHPLLRHPQVIVTPHIASTTLPQAAAQRVCRLIERHRSGLPMEGVIDRRRGY
ncbi:2-hydroxyacid dehydrogenase [Microvirga sesbaniae]|uniref:2-hydroxyacid dehydrogenase n=1 Tax=Microvirga sesbaniae TaxID=681392 RepID=UPI0021C7B337|nr:glyoxylate/hydroxypyruvate reductase A [Microvirga sp. HBU67692]